LRWHNKKREKIGHSSHFVRMVINGGSAWTIHTNENIGGRMEIQHENQHDPARYYGCADGLIG